MELIESPNGQYDDGSGNMVDYPLNFYYALHADLDPTLKADHTTDWSGMNADIENVLFPAKKPFKIKSFGAYYGEITDGQTITVGKDFLSQVFFFQTEPTKPGASVPEIEWTTGAVPADWSTIFDPNYAQQMGLIADSAKSQMTLPYPSTGISAMDPSKVSGIVAFESYSDHRAATITFANGSLSVTATPKDGSAPVSFNINVNVNPIKVTSFVFDPSPGSYNDGDETDVIQGQVSTVELDPDAAHTFRIKASDVLPFKQLIFTIGNTYNSADVADLPDIGVTTIKEGQEYEISIPAKWYENHDIDNKIGNDSKIILGALPSYFIDLYVNHPTP
jgi:hypothetical protein